MKLCIDPGHGFGNIGNRYDPGAVAAGVTEADIVLAWALTIKHVFRQAGVEVFLTRDDASDVTPVGSRDDKANAAGCTHFLSLHCNAGPILATGTETLYRDDTDWALKVQTVALETLKLRNRGIKHESVTRHGRLSVMSFRGKACLLELGFISNPGDRKKLGDRNMRIAFAQELLKTWKRMGG
jgi:N-acetylmuramoyl-L-alanine amidase